MTSCDTLHDGTTVGGREGGCNDDDDGQGVVCIHDSFVPSAAFMHAECYSM
jgi:hypothetical protein